HLSPRPGPPCGARQCLRWTTAARLSVPATARTTTEPPWPPSPPSGPPLGTYFSRRKLTQPRPPSPPLTKMVTRSMNIGLLYQVVSSFSARRTCAIAVSPAIAHVLRALNGEDQYALRFMNPCHTA